MKYTVNHPSQDNARALHLDKKAEQRIDNAIGKAFTTPGYENVDEIIGRVAPYLHTPEEAFYAAISINAHVQVAMDIVGNRWP